MGPRPARPGDRCLKGFTMKNRKILDLNPSRIEIESAFSEAATFDDGPRVPAPGGVMKECAYCGQEFQGKGVVADGQTFCSQECADAYAEEDAGDDEEEDDLAIDDDE